MNNEYYDNPLISRYASGEMARIFGAEKKFRTWRKLWVALAQSQQQTWAQNQ